MYTSYCLKVCYKLQESKLNLYFKNAVTAKGSLVTPRERCGSME